MKKKIFLTSMLALAFACPAMAEDGNEFIENGDTCNIDNLGTSTNNDTANIEAIWNLVSVPCSAGQYFNASTASCETCSAGSWCVAGTYDVENNQTGAGSTLCSTLANGEYTLSADGSSENTQCYRNCSTSDVAHSATVSGGYYYGGNNQCSPTSCAAGWHIKEGTNFAEQFGSYGTTWGYVDSRSTFYENSSYSDYSYTKKGRDYYGLDLSESRSFAVAFTTNGRSDTNLGMLKGMGVCSNQIGYKDTVNNNNDAWNNPTTFDNLSEESGRYCYCNISEYITSEGEVQYLPAIYVFVEDFNAGWQCTGPCGARCAKYIGGSQYQSSITSGSRAAILSAISEDSVNCGSNSVKINLYNDSVANSGTKVGTGSCSYGNTVGKDVSTTPTKPGYRFIGWTLRNSNNNNNQ